MADEVDLIWRHKPSVSSALFIANRIGAWLIVVFLALNDVDNVRHTLRVDHCHLNAF